MASVSSSQKGARKQTRSKMSRSSLRLLALGLIGVGVVLLIAAAVSFGIIRIGSSAPTLQGATINPPSPAPDFQLEDQFGQNIRLSSFHGKVVALTFLYTNCPDACPIITEKLRQASDLLGPDARKLAILAVTVDPARDTMAQVRSYSALKGMLDKWHFLIGSQAQLAPVWKEYGTAAVPQTTIATPLATTAAASGTPAPAQGSSYSIDHSAPIYVIDPKGDLRAILDINFAPADLVQDVRALASTSN